MRRPGRTLTLWLVLLGGALAAPAAILAQAMTKESVVGTWVSVAFYPMAGVRVHEWFYAFHEDGTVEARDNVMRVDGTEYHNRLNPVDLGISGGPDDAALARQGKARPKILWRLKGDSLLLYEGNKSVAGVMKVLFQHQGQAFLWGRIGHSPQGFACEPPREFERIDTTKPRATPTPPPPGDMLKFADLVGTWTYPTVIYDSLRRPDTLTETITLRSDSTWSWKESGAPASWGTARSYSGRWSISADNYLVTSGADGSGLGGSHKFVLQNGGKDLVAPPRTTVCYTEDGTARDDRQPESVMHWKRVSP